MKNANYILEELNIISPLIGQIEKKETYSVSLEYFNDLSLEILNRINTDKLRAYFSKSSSSFKVPENYFKDFPGLVLQNILEKQKKHDEVFEELQEISPLLNTISKTPVFQTPDKYFDNLLSAANFLHSRPVKVELKSRRLKLVRYAAAAVVIPFIAIGLYTITTNQLKNPRSNPSNARNAVKHLSKEEIISFLKNDASENTTSTSRAASKNDNPIKSSLKRISDKEIQQFLKETGESDEI